MRISSHKRPIFIQIAGVESKFVDFLSKIADFQLKFAYSSGKMADFASFPEKAKMFEIKQIAF